MTKNLLNPNGIHGLLPGQYQLTHQALGVLLVHHHLAVLVQVLVPVLVHLAVHHQVPLAALVLLAAHLLLHGNQVGELRDTIIYHSLLLLLKHPKTNKI